MMGRKIFDESGYFFVSNVFFDEMMPSLSANAFKVLCVVMRHTWGCEGDKQKQGREAARISYEQFMEITGIGSRTTISKAIQECINAGYLVRRDAREGKNPGFVYSLRLESRGQ